MVEYKNIKGQAQIRFSGDLPEALADVMMLVNSLYNDFKDVDTEYANLFRDTLRDVIAHDPNLFTHIADKTEQSLESACRKIHRNSQLSHRENKPAPEERRLKTK